ncbi:dienelactone hydrolase family protein [Agrobacterium tumefaciens]|uniref:Dienelactone hydrolase n=1 Tax=Agrobacterium tumefaciens TaxID=358 RepID=A0A2L2LME3_AGRTU|nr:dienelactone hydrolase family protein [Agrobacterium tumefaciens]AVH45398.1 dienelactone hydrolase [Agrobacterium tumefaciens]NSY99127.1 dienelactone hydrolase family protein [Agrobacterium tumefaciens]
MQSKEIEYDVDGVTFKSILLSATETRPDQPLMLIAPNWIGVSPEAIKRAERLVGEQYIGLVVDMYGKGRVAQGPDEAAELANGLRADTRTRRLRMQAALRALRAAVGDHAAVRPVVAVGFCFGGGNVLELARTGADLHAAVSIHGDLVTKAPAGKGDIKADILILHGSQDPVEPQAHRLSLEKELESAGARWQMCVFGGLVHSFCEEEADVKGIAEYSPWGARRSYAMLDAILVDSLSNTSRS